MLIERHFFPLRYPFNPNQAISDPDWEEYLRGTAALILKEQSPRNLLEIRNRLYELISHCIPPAKIFRVRIQSVQRVDYGYAKCRVWWRSSPRYVQG
jgi:hypothetical protein